MVVFDSIVRSRQIILFPQVLWQSCFLGIRKTIVISEYSRMLIHLLAYDSTEIFTTSTAYVAAPLYPFSRNAILRTSYWSYWDQFTKYTIVLGKSGLPRSPQSVTMWLHILQVKKRRESMYIHTRYWGNQDDWSARSRWYGNSDREYYVCIMRSSTRYLL